MVVLKVSTVIVLVSARFLLASIPSAVSPLLERDAVFSNQAAFWLEAVRAEEWETVVANWGGVNTYFTESMEVPAYIAYLNGIKELGMLHFFLEELKEASLKEKLLSSPVFQKTIEGWQPDLENEAYRRGLLLKEQEISQWDPKAKIPFLNRLKIWSRIRKDFTSISSLPKDHAWRTYLIQGKVLDLLKKKQLKAAYTLLMQEWEGKRIPEERKNAHRLQRARVLYMAGALEQAENWYRQIERGSEEYIEAQEELAWTWLRLHKIPELRGQLTTLGSSFFEDSFLPERFVVRGISNLKMCQLAATKKDIEQFIETNSYWGQKVDAALKEGMSERPPKADWYTIAIENGVHALESEAQRIQGMQEQSQSSSQRGKTAGAYLGKIETRLKTRKQWMLEVKNAEYKRQWKNIARLLSEANKKMHYVKVELMLMVNKNVRPIIGEAQKREVQEYMGTIKETASGKWSFPVDEVFWPDEAFRMLGTAAHQCL